MIVLPMGYLREPLMQPLHRDVDHTAPSRLVLVIGGRRPSERAVADCLAQRGLRCIFEPALDQVAALQGQVLFDAVVVDVCGEPGAMASALARVRQRFTGRLLVVADSDDEVDEIMALELGADDYLRAPVSPRRLRARLLALLRTPRPGEPPSRDLPLELPRDGLGGWQLDIVHLRLARGAQTIALTETQVQLLQCLQQHAGRVVPRAELHDRVCPGHSDIRARTIDVYVHRLRKRLADEGAHEIRIEAVRGRGFVLQVEPAAPAPPALRAVT